MMALAATIIVWMSNVTDPMVTGPTASRANTAVPTTTRKTAGYRKSQRGLNTSRNRRCRHPSRHVRRWGSRLRPSGLRVVGTSVMASPPMAARTTISVANSIPVV